MRKKRARRFETISDIEKQQIVSEWQSGNFYSKEICEEHHITYFTIKKCVEYTRGLRK